MKFEPYTVYTTTLGEVWQGGREIRSRIEGEVITYSIPDSKDTADWDSEFVVNARSPQEAYSIADAVVTKTNESNGRVLIVIGRIEDPRTGVSWDPEELGV